LKVEPLDLTLENGKGNDYVSQKESEIQEENAIGREREMYIRVITRNHFPPANLVADAVCWFIWVHWQFKIHARLLCWCY